MEDWRAPIVYLWEETTEALGPVDGHGNVVTMHKIYSPESFSRIESRRACWSCDIGFPAEPGPGSLQEFRRVLRSGELNLPHIPREVCLDRVRNRCCPMCGAPVTAEMIATQLRSFEIRKELIRA